MASIGLNENLVFVSCSIIFVFSENEFEKIENYPFYLNISTESNKEQAVEVFQVRLKGQKTKERSMKEYSTH